MIFDGVTYQPELDFARLSRQLVAVKTLMLDGVWRTLREIYEATGFPEQSISARLRDLRKPRMGSMIVERRRRAEAERGIFEYRINLEETNGK